MFRYLPSFIHGQFVHLRSQGHALTGAQGFAVFFGAQSLGFEVGLGQFVFIKIAAVRAEIFLLKLIVDALSAQESAGVHPGHCFYGRLVQGQIGRNVGAIGIACGKNAKIFSIGLFYSSKAPKLALGVVVITVVIGVGIAETGVAPLVFYRRLFYHLHRKGQFSDPGLARPFVAQVTLGGGFVFHRHRLAEVVAVAGHDVGFLATHQVDVAHGLVRIPRQGRRPYNATRATAQ